MGIHAIKRKVAPRRMDLDDRNMWNLRSTLGQEQDYPSRASSIISLDMLRDLDDLNAEKNSEVFKALRRVKRVVLDPKSKVTGNARTACTKNQKTRIWDRMLQFLGLAR